MKRRYLLVAAPLVALSLAVAGTAVAAGNHTGGGNYSHLGTHFGWSFGRGAAPLGSVTSLSGSTLSVLEFDGTTQTYTVTDATNYFLDGKPATSAAVVAGLNVVVIAPHQWGNSGGGTSSTPDALGVYLISPNVLGNIQSVIVGSSGDTIAVLNPQGFAFTIQTSAATTFYVGGVAATSTPSFTIGEVIAALGLVDGTNKDQLDATSVNVVPAHSHTHR